MSEAPRVLLHTDAPDEARDVVRAAHPDLEIETCDSYAALPDALVSHEPEVVYGVRFENGPYPRDALMACPSLKWLSVGGSGTDHLQPWDADHLTVTNAAGVAADMMAEYVLGTLLSFTLDLRGFHRDQRARRWRSGATVESVAGKTALIVGLGQTGRAVARLLKAVGLGTLGVRANPEPTEDVDEVHGTDALPDLWARADVVVVCLPLLASSRGLIDQAAFAAMSRRPILIDVSRGSIVVQSALVEALEAGRLRAAALDVFETEPLPPGRALWGRQDVLITPHCSSVYDGWTRRSVEMFTENLGRYRRGEPLGNVVSPKRGY